ncbi:MAG: aldo/keto reductase, partial [Halofilum sp. (in: g-proteobacteria)]
MQYRPLGTTDLRVSEICLGTMTWGQQNTEAEAHAQLDLAVERGVNFIDTAEMYPVPARAETQGLTEQYIGSWLARRSDRDRLVVATKVSGPSTSTDVRRPSRSKTS